MEKNAAMSGGPDVQSILVTEKTPEEIQKGVSELLQRLENEWKAQEKLAEENKRRFQLMMNPPRVLIGQSSDVHDNENTDAMDLGTTSATSYQRSQPTIGETTISTQEEERFRAEVRAVMR